MKGVKLPMSMTPFQTPAREHLYMIFTNDLNNAFWTYAEAQF